MRFIKLLIAFALLTSPAFATWTMIQHATCNAACAAGTTCAITVTSTGSGHLGVVTAHVDIGGTQVISSVSGGGTYSTDVNSTATDATAGKLSFAYTLNSVSGATTVTVTLGGSTANPWRACYREYSSTTTFAFDTSANRDASTAAANLAGVTLTPTGANDVMIQAGVFAGTASGGGTYGNCDFPNGNGTCDRLNQGSGTANTWVSTSGRAALGAIAFKETSGATKTCTLALMGAGPC